MILPDAALRHVVSDQVAWLTTVTVTGRPSPTPVWFVADGTDLVVFAEPTARKAANVVRNPAVTLHFNSDPAGEDVVVVHADATLETGRRPTAQPGYLDKYADGIVGLGLTLETFDATYDTLIRLTPVRVWLGPS